MDKRPIRQVSTSGLADNTVGNVSMGLVNDQRVKSTIRTWTVAHWAALTIKSLVPLEQGLFYTEYAETGSELPSS